MIKVNNLHKSYSSGQESIEVLKGIDLEIKDGQIICVLGPSGSGKLCWIRFPILQLS